MKINRNNFYYAKTMRNTIQYLQCNYEKEQYLIKLLTEKEIKIYEIEKDEGERLKKKKRLIMTRIMMRQN